MSSGRPGDGLDHFCLNPEMCATCLSRLPATASAVPLPVEDSGQGHPDASCVRVTQVLDPTSHCHHWLNEEQPCCWCGYRGDEAEPCSARPAPGEAETGGRAACDRLTAWLRATHDGSCRICGRGNEHVDQHAADCEAAPVIALALRTPEGGK